MIIGPAIATFVINNWGLAAVVNGTAGMIPTPSLFLVSAVITLLTAAPLMVAGKLYIKRKLSNTSQA